jgi:hypothetical protein
LITRRSVQDRTAFARTSKIICVKLNVIPNNVKRRPRTPLPPHKDCRPTFDHGRVRNRSHNRPRSRSCSESR